MTCSTIRHLLQRRRHRHRGARLCSRRDAIEGVTHEELVARIRARGHRDARVIDRPEALAPLIASRASEGDYVVCLGAGNITQWAASLPAELGALIGKEPELP